MMARRPRETRQDSLSETCQAFVATVVANGSSYGVHVVLGLRTEDPYWIDEREAEENWGEGA
jgi:hypothetical protein